MSKINIHRGTFLEKEELTRMIGFLDEKPEVSAIFAASLSFGLVSPNSKPGLPFKVTASTTLGSFNMVGGYVIGGDLKAYKVDNQTDFPVPNDNQYYWLKVGRTQRNYENGYVQVDVSGNVSGTVNFEGVVRGQSSGVPTCIKFVKDDGSTPLNNQVYQIVDIINNNNIVLSSGYAFQAESQLRVVVLGSIPMGRRFTEEQLQGLYTFDTYKLTLVVEPSEGTEPAKNANEYWIARVKNNGGVITVLDEREEFWNLGGSSPSGEFYTFAINPTPSNAKVIIDGVVTNSVESIDGRTLSWSVSAPRYLTKTGTYTVNGKSETIDVVLEEDPNPSEQVTIIVKTSSEGVFQGTVSINNPSTIDKAEDSITVDSGTTVQIASKPADGYRFVNWLKNSEVYNNIEIQDVIADFDTTYIAVFKEDPQADYWDFETKVSDIGEETELFTVPTPAGTGEFEGMMVKVNESQTTQNEEK